MSGGRCRAFDDERRPLLLDGRDVLDEPAEAERADRRREPSLLVGEP